MAKGAMLAVLAMLGALASAASAEPPLEEFDRISAAARAAHARGDREEWLRLSDQLLRLLVSSMTRPEMTDRAAREFDRLFTAARAARERGDHPEYLRNVEKLVELLPGHPSMIYSLARGRALIGDAAGSLAILSRLADLGFGYDPGADPSFARLAALPGHDAVARRLADNRTLKGDLKPSRALGLAGQNVEGVAALGLELLIGSESGNLYRHNPHSDAPTTIFAKSPWTLLGIRPERDGKHILACTSDEASGLASILRFRGADGALLSMTPLPARRPLCNDIEMLGSNIFAVTDSNNGAVYLGKGRDIFRMPLMQSLFYPNGIVVGETGHIYVAHGGGILSFLPIGTSEPLKVDGTLIGAIDGMVWHKGSIIALQNLSVPARLLRITPDSTGTNAKVEVIASGHQALADSTTVAILGDEAFILTKTSPGPDKPAEPALFRIRI